jgi:NAD(P)-dependent dehydrogenase (short-subunit alcohol dehydrogenase family)
VPTPSGAPSPLASEAPYVPRRPHDTVLYGIVREPLATFLADAARAYAAALPSYAVAAFEGYLACGDLARGLLRCPCDGCGHDVLVAFSCKSRGLCPSPSCGVRRMCNEAATLVDRVLPNAPLRQWVLSLPFELRGLAATKPDVLGAMDRIFAEEIERLTKRLAGFAGAATGSIGFPQRFGSSMNLHVRSSMNLHVHLHTLALDAGALDADLQQIDLRTHNSWRATLAEVPTVELLEVHLVNAVAPFVLSGKLKPLMRRHRTNDKHIVNVSAVEGQFYREHKTDKHPHTNMAKAALNMLTRTSAGDYARDGIYMNSVDTGWVTDEDPAALTAMKREVHGFHPPLDVVDGAARICDPIFSGFLTGEHAYGQFFKDYKPTAW